MRTRLLVLALAVLTLLPIGCAAGFQVGSDRTGIGAGASIGHDSLLVTPDPPPRP